jgi:hypothetical protein
MGGTPTSTCSISPTASANVTANGPISAAAGSKWRTTSCTTAEERAAPNVYAIGLIRSLSYRVNSKHRTRPTGRVSPCSEDLAVP